VIRRGGLASLAACAAFSVASWGAASAQAPATGAAVQTAAVVVDPAADPANWRKVDPENLLQFTIKRQPVLIELRPDFAPVHVAQIRKITRDGNYNALPFHRVIDDFMAQGGEVSAIYMLPQPYPEMKGEFTFRRDPVKAPVQWIGGDTTDKFGYLDGFLVQGKPDVLAAMNADKRTETWALHCAGVTSMARTNDPNSADTQFFLMRQARSGTMDEFGGLDKTYTVWGRALVGLDVIRAIKAGPDETDGRLSGGAADKLGNAQMVADMVERKRPSVYVQRTDGPAFAETLKTLAANDPISACALPQAQVVVVPPANG
jgi:peptidylprolyl isomerase